MASSLNIGICKESIALALTIGLETVEEFVDWLAVGEGGGVDYGDFRRERTITPDIKLEVPRTSNGAFVANIASTSDYLEKIRKFKRLYEGQIQRGLEKGKLFLYLK